MWKIGDARSVLLALQLSQPRRIFLVNYLRNRTLSWNFDWGRADLIWALRPLCWGGV